MFGYYMTVDDYGWFGAKISCAASGAVMDNLPNVAKGYWI